MTALHVLDGDLLRVVLNLIIPPCRNLPGAGDLGLAAKVEETLGGSPSLRRLLLDGITLIQGSNAQPFADLDEATQTAHLQRVEQMNPAFFSALVEHTYRAYYTDPSVLRALGWQRAPQPLGHSLPPFDPELLVRQRARAPFWRRTT
jgi:hypothetical protein